MFGYELRSDTSIIAFHNFLGVYGVMQTLSAAGALAAYQTPLLPLIGMAVVSLVVFVLVDVFYVRRGGTASEYPSFSGQGRR